MSSARASILVVDDEYSLVEALTDILETEGYAVQSASNGQRALTAVELQLPDLILLDYMMPVMDGLRFLAQLEERSLLEKVPVILMTAAPNGLPRDAAERRWTELLPKPFELDRLLALVERVLEPRGANPR